MGPKLHRFFIWKKFSSAFLCNLWPLRKTGCTCFWIFVTNACIYIWRRTEIKFLYEIFIIHYNWGDEMTSLYTLHLQKPSYLSRILHLNGWFKGTTLWNYFEIIRKWFVIMQVLYCLISVASPCKYLIICSYKFIFWKRYFLPCFYDEVSFFKQQDHFSFVFSCESKDPMWTIVWV